MSHNIRHSRPKLGKSPFEFVLRNCTLTSIQCNNCFRQLKSWYTLHSDDFRQGLAQRDTVSSYSVMNDYQMEESIQCDEFVLCRERMLLLGSFDEVDGSDISQSEQSNPGSEQPIILE